MHRWTHFRTGPVGLKDLGTGHCGSRVFPENCQMRSPGGGGPRLLWFLGVEPVTGWDRHHGKNHLRLTVPLFELNSHPTFWEIRCWGGQKSSGTGGNRLGAFLIQRSAQSQQSVAA